MSADHSLPALLDVLLDHCDAIVRTHEPLRMDTEDKEELRQQVIAGTRKALVQCREVRDQLTEAWPDVPAVQVCPGCGASGWVCTVCDYVLEDDRDRCNIEHPQFGFTCPFLPRDHGDVHFDPSGGHWTVAGGQLSRSRLVSPEGDGAEHDGGAGAVSALADLDPCEPGTVTPLCTTVAWFPPDPEIGNPWFPVPIGTWNSEDGLQWPPRTPGTWAPDDIETENAR